MHRYGYDFGWNRSAGGRGQPGYDMQFGNWGARSGLDPRAAPQRGRPATDSGGGRWGGGPRPSASGGYDRYDTSGRPGGYGARRGSGGIRGQGTARWRGGYDEAYGVRPSPGGAPGYDRGYPRGYDRGHGSGFGMAGLHEQMMYGQGEGFGYAGDYHRTHPIRPEEVRGGRKGGGAQGRFGGSQWRGR